jgi:hypothetical protein
MEETGYSNYQRRSSSPLPKALSPRLANFEAPYRGVPNPYPPPELKNRNILWWLLLVVAALLVWTVVQFSTPPETMPATTLVR